MFAMIFVPNDCRVYKNETCKKNCRASGTFIYVYKHSSKRFMCLNNIFILFIYNVKIIYLTVSRYLSILDIIDYSIMWIFLWSIRILTWHLYAWNDLYNYNCIHYTISLLSWGLIVFLKMVTIYAQYINMCYSSPLIFNDEKQFRFYTNILLI